MRKAESPIFTLETFEGSIDFLLHLIQKNEVDIENICLRLIIQQFMQRELVEENESIDTAAEFIATSATLLWLKSKHLLPKEEVVDVANFEDDPHFDIIYQLIDHCHFKQVAHDLSEREDRQNAYYQRGYTSGPFKKPLGLENVSLQDLAIFFKKVLEKSPPRQQWVIEEQWQVSDKIAWIRSLLAEKSRIEFFGIFALMHARGELIVTFLAILELMKLGNIKVMRDNSTLQTDQPLIWIVA